MAEATEPIHFLDVCSQKFSDFVFNAEHKCLMWLREIEEEAMKMFDSSLNAEPALMPKTPSQKKHRKKKRSSFFKDDNKELTRKRLSKRRSGIKPSSIELSLSKENLELTASCKTNLFAKETLEVHCHETVIHPVEERALAVDFNKNNEVKGKMDEETSSMPEVSTMCPDGHCADRVGTTEAAGVLDVSAVMLPNSLDPSRTGKDTDTSRLSTSTPKPSLHVKPAGGGELSLAQQVDNDNLVQEGAVSQDLKDNSGTSGGSQSGRRLSNRSHKNRKVSLVEKYSLTSKRKSMIRKSISKSIAKKKATQNSSSTSSRVSCHSSIDMFLDDETSGNGPPLLQNAQSDEEPKMLPKTPCALDVPGLVAAENPDQPETEEGKICSEESLAIKMTGSQVGGSEDSTQSSQPHEKSIRSQSYKQALDELPTAQPTKEEDLSSFSQKPTSPPANQPPSPSGSARITRPFKNFFQTMQKSQLFKPPGSPGSTSIMKSLVKHTTPATKPDTREKERQRLESLRKKQEAEQQRKQKVEEEKRRRLEEIKLKREERLRKALQARERVEQMEEEKRKRMEQKFSQHEERSEKVREEKMAEEKTKRKVSMKKMGDTEARKQKTLQMEEEQKFQEQPEKWKTVWEIKKMLEHKNAKQAVERHHGQQDKEKWVKQQDLAVVTEEEENQKEEKSPTSLEPLPQEKKANHVEVAATKWLNITAQKSPISTSNHMNPQDQKDCKSLRSSPNDYGMDLNSDDSTDDESQPRKPIPPWAAGLQLNEAVTYQYYNPPDIDTFFGQILSPKLEDIFYKSKPRYFKRTSSAVWQSPPLPGTKTALRASSSMKK